MKKIWRSTRIFLSEQWNTLINLQDSTENVLRGFTLGIFIGFLPIMGVQIMIVCALFAVCRYFALPSFNLIAATIAVFVTNPLTVVPIYLFNAQVGVWILGTKITKSEFMRLREVSSGEEFYTIVMRLGELIIWPLILGSFVVALVLAIFTYFGMKPILLKYHNWQKEH